MTDAIRLFIVNAVLEPDSKCLEVFAHFNALHCGRVLVHSWPAAGVDGVRHEFMVEEFHATFPYLSPWTAAEHEHRPSKNIVLAADVLRDQQILFPGAIVAGAAPEICAVERFAGPSFGVELVQVAEDPQNLFRRVLVDAASESGFGIAVWDQVLHKPMGHCAFC